MKFAVIDAAPVGIASRAPYQSSFDSQTFLAKAIVVLAIDIGATGLGKMADGDVPLAASNWR
jgi:hypothetical protein